MIETPETVLRGLPEWTDATVERLARGQTVGSWIVDAGDRKAVLKIDDAPRTGPFNTRPAEAQIQMAAARQGLANNVLLVTDTVLMTEYVEGVVWSLDCLEDSATLHSLPLPFVNCTPCR